MLRPDKIPRRLLRRIAREIARSEQGLSILDHPEGKEKKRQIIARSIDIFRELKQNPSTFYEKHKGIYEYIVAKKSKSNLPTSQGGRISRSYWRIAELTPDETRRLIRRILRKGRGARGKEARRFRSQLRRLGRYGGLYNDEVQMPGV